MIIRLFFAVFATIAILTLHGGEAFAAKPSRGGTPDSPSILTGNDISWPQCGKPLPKGQAFGIVGVNGGKATTGNPCLAQQLEWADTSNGLIAEQPKVQVYVNTGNPGEVLEEYKVTTWPTDNNYKRHGVTYTTSESPYGECTGSFDGKDYSTLVNDQACSWQYGWNRAVQAVDEFFTPAIEKSSLKDKNPASYTWWLDVETMNSWQGETDNVDSPARDAKYARNTATLEGMMAFYTSIKITKVGIYSTGYQWNKIVGRTVSAESNLNYRDSWLAGAANLKDAQTRCSLKPLTLGGATVMNQYIAKNLDYNYACPLPYTTY